MSLKNKSTTTTKNKKSLNKTNIIKEIQNPTQDLDTKLEQINSLVSNLDKKYSTQLKIKINQITEKYDVLINDIINKYNFKFDNDNEEETSKEENSKEKNEELENLYNNRDIEIIQLKLKYIEMSDKKEQVEEVENLDLELELNKEVVDNYEDASYLYESNLIHKRIKVPFIKLGNNMNEYFKKYSEKYIEGICHKEGYIKPYSTNIVEYSTGRLQSDYIMFDVTFSVDVCFPYENMEIMCKIKNITKIGIRGVVNEDNNPIVLFISREHNSNIDFDNYEEGQYIKVKVIGNRFEENDKYISVIGEII